MREFWRNKRVLITGHTGFKGGWLATWLHHLDAKVSGIALEPNTSPNLFQLLKLDKKIESHICDIRDMGRLKPLIQATKPELVFHMAAQPLVRPSYREPLTTFSTNVMGTAHVLESLRDLTSVKAVISVTTDKVYKNREWQYPYREDDPLGGHDPYSASKAASEILVASYRDSFLKDQGIAVATARAGNVIGGGDWSEDRLIPDALRAWSKGDTLHVRRPSSTRPWQHVLEPLYGYLLLAERLWSDPKFASAWNFGPETHETATVREVIGLARESFGQGEVHWGTQDEGPHEAGLLALEISKARAQLGFRPRWDLPTAVERTMRWYREQQQGEDAWRLCESDLKEFGA